MSRLSDYSKFDHLEESSSDEEEQKQRPPASAMGASGEANATTTTAAAGDPLPSAHQAQADAAAAAPLPVPVPVATNRKDPDTGRYVFEYGGTKIYEWEQTLEEVNLYVAAPPHHEASNIHCVIQPHHLQLGLAGNDRLFLDEDTFSLVDTSESFWYMSKNDKNNDSADEICIVLSKAHRAELWTSALKGRTLQQAANKDSEATTTTTTSPTNAMQLEEMKKSLLLERFGEEHPGFDFRDAEFNGSVPDARTFQGGIKYK